MKRQESIVIEKLKLYGGTLVKHSTPFSFKWWVEYSKVESSFRFDYNHGITSDFFKLFEFIKTDHTTRSYYKLKQ